MKCLRDPFYLLAALAVSPVVLYRALRHGRYRQGWPQRVGHIARQHPQRPCIWLHAVSVGETNAALVIVDGLQNQYPDHEVVISATTDTGVTRATQLFGEKCTVFYFPFDLSWIITRAFRLLQPRLCLLMELEVWPNFMEVAAERNIPVIVVNGRISDRSFRTYHRFRWAVQASFQRLSRALAQTEEYAERFRQLGCPASRVIVTGSLKYDTAQMTNPTEDAETLAHQLGLSGQRIWVAGGTGNGEEEQIVAIYKNLLKRTNLQDLRLVIVPRKPERFEGVAQVIEQAGLPLQRFSVIKEGSQSSPVPAQAVILGDTMGDLRTFYTLATVVFVGRSLTDMGGSDMMEVAALGKPTLMGPYTYNFRQTVTALLEAQGALQVEDQGELERAVTRCLDDPVFANTLAKNGQTVIRNNQGATKKTLQCIHDVLP